MKKKILILSGLAIILIVGFSLSKKINFNTTLEVGAKIDSLNGVVVYYNGGVGNVEGRTLSNDGYNIGLKYQCVEFVKRYYYEALQHKMPDSYGHAKDFFNSSIADGALNKQRNLTQYTNRSTSKPAVNDLVVYAGSLFNRYGHVSIISKVSDNEIEIIQQNPGPFGDSREVFELSHSDGLWYIENKQILGWLRK